MTKRAHPFFKVQKDSDFIVFALFTYWLHWNFDLYKYLAEQCQI